MFYVEFMITENDVPATSLEFNVITSDVASIGQIVVCCTVTGIIRVL